MELCTQPLTGGMPAEKHSLRAFWSEFISETSQHGAATRTPCSSRSWMSSLANTLALPDLESRMRYLAPRLAIHLAMLRPRPPRPPEITKVASGSKSYVLFRLGTICEQSR
ncbi:hypothetical protein L228DRAFT_146143 [Xylona heveae TC161]|uniref:Uncharacterized protein n=1 Tax=Xylona heveae (strain CBS 132557 / TC161) TaxID=1328760 RepID=A0A165GEM5_XYLHT|nr:hypothetical protein L228DRAFT_146143 [Xylona heveae TC161]KZF22097.1 hypothetical protein L228DRAFT_146143 [Xylona heveae TC161]